MPCKTSFQCNPRLGQKRTKGQVNANTIHAKKQREKEAMTLYNPHIPISLSNLMQTLMALPYNPMQSFYKETKYFHLHHVSFMSKTWIAHSHARLSCKPKLDKIKLQTHGKTVACKLKTHHGFHDTFIFHTSLRQTHFHARTHAKIKPQTPCFYNKSLRHLHKTPCKALKNKTIPMHKLTASKANLLC